MDGGLCKTGTTGVGLSGSCCPVISDASSKRETAEREQRIALERAGREVKEGAERRSQDEDSNSDP